MEAFMAASKEQMIAIIKSLKPELTEEELREVGERYEQYLAKLKAERNTEEWANLSYDPSLSDLGHDSIVFQTIRPIRHAGCESVIIFGDQHWESSCVT